jgi:hypothetical protein
MGEKRTAYMLLEGKSEEKGPLGRPRSRWVDNIEMHLVEIGWVGVNSFGLDQDGEKWIALVNAVMKFWSP